jgi:hypothetical protein
VGVAALLAACGGSSSGGTTTSTAAPVATAAPTTPPSTHTASYPQTTSHTSTAGATNVRLPATFTISAGGKLTPPSVSAPRGVLIGLTVISGDGRAHRVSVAYRALVVPAGGRANSALQGLHRGRYPVLVDGAQRGTLIVGGQVGP